VTWLLVGRAPASSTTTPTTRFILSTAEARVAFTGGRLLAISPDGRTFVYVGTDGAGQQLFKRRAGELAIERIDGTEDGRDPVFSPDGEWIAFTQGNDIKRVRTTGGPALTVARGAYGSGGGIHWGEDGTIVFSAAGIRYGVGLVPGTGGDVRIVTGSDSTHGAYRWPHILPDGRAALVTLFPSLEETSIGLLDLSTGAVEVLLTEGTFPQYVSSGHLVYGHGSGAVFAVPFDVRSRRLAGQPTPVLEGVQVFSGGATQFAASAAGTVAYLAGDRELTSPVLVDRSGREVEQLPLRPDFYEVPRFAPDGNRIAFEVEGDRGSIRVYDRRAGTLSLLSTEESSDVFGPVWDDRGTWVYYGKRSLDGTGAVVRRRADGSGDAEPIAVREQDFTFYPAALGSDGRLLTSVITDSGYDVLVYAPSEDETGAPFLSNAWDETTPRISPDGRWVAYVSDESGAPEVYLTSYPVPAGRTQVSRDGGTEPVWSPSGREIFYRTPDDGFMAARLAFGGAPAVMGRDLLFSAPDYVAFANWGDYDVHPDGDLFVFIRRPQQTTSGITVVVNWFDELRSLLGEDGA